MKHPSKEIRKALKEAEAAGWTVKKASARSHAWGRIYCPYGHSQCQMSIWSTPRVPEHHARLIRAYIRKCPGP